jgi:hypothetical protein
MFCCKRLSNNLLIIFSFLLTGEPAWADRGDYIAGIGAQADTADGRAISLFGDFGVSDSAWLSAAAGHTQTDGVLGFDALYADIGLDYSFEPIGIRIGGAYWGDSELLDSVDYRGSLYFRNDRLSLSGDYERREFDFTYQPLFGDGERTVDFYADGVGLTSWLRTSKNTSLYLGGMDYEYSIDIRLQENIDSVRALTVSRLSIINSLIDYRLNAGLNIRLGTRTLDVNVSNWRTELDQGQVTSYGVGLTTPLDDFSDLEVRIAYDESENFGSTWVFSLFFYTFGS